MSSSQDCPVYIRVQAEDFEISQEINRISHDRKDIGAIVTFTGLCRNENGTLSALELEHYPAMAERQIKRIAQHALERWPLHGLSVIHRYGLIKPGHNIVLVIAASSHRQAAFEAASFLMDYMKTDAPFWKREHLSNGKAGAWVSTKEEDQKKRDRW